MVNHRPLPPKVPGHIESTDLQPQGTNLELLIELHIGVYIEFPQDKCLKGMIKGIADQPFLFRFYYGVRHFDSTTVHGKIFLVTKFPKIL